MISNNSCDYKIQARRESLFLFYSWVSQSPEWLSDRSKVIQMVNMLTWRVASWCQVEWSVYHTSQLLLLIFPMTNTLLTGFQNSLLIPKALIRIESVWLPLGSQRSRFPLHSLPFSHPGGDSQRKPTPAQPAAGRRSNMNSHHWLLHQTVHERLSIEVSSQVCRQTGGGKKRKIQQRS